MQHLDVSGCDDREQPISVLLGECQQARVLALVRQRPAVDAT
nr:hypothetical protein [Plantactinospora soyae]